MANEPVAWHYPDGKPDQCTINKEYAEKEPAWTPMYYKHEWVGLTDEEIWGVIDRTGTSNSDVNPYQIIKNARAIEAKLKEKNT
jgi:hypothetical protein